MLAEILELADLDVISGAEAKGLGLAQNVGPDRPWRLGFGGARGIEVILEKEERATLGPVYPLTPFGKDLCQLAEDAEPPAEFEEAIREAVVAEGRTVFSSS